MGATNRVIAIHPIIQVLKPLVNIEVGIVELLHSNYCVFNGWPNEVAVLMSADHRITSLFKMLISMLTASLVLVPFGLCFLDAFNTVLHPGGIDNGNKESKDYSYEHLSHFDFVHFVPEVQTKIL